MNKILCFSLFIFLLILQLNGQEIVKNASAYLMETNKEKKAGLLKDLSAFKGDPLKVMEALQEAEPKQWLPDKGILKDCKFKHPQLKEKYEEDHIYFHVPDSYNTEKSSALVIFTSWFLLSPFRYKITVSECDFLSASSPSTEISTS